MDETKLVLDVKEAAHRLSLSHWTIRKWISTGKITATHLGGRVMIEPRELMRLIEAGRKKKS